MKAGGTTETEAETCETQAHTHDAGSAYHVVGFFVALTTTFRTWRTGKQGYSMRTQRLLQL